MKLIVCSIVVFTCVVFGFAARARGEEIKIGSTGGSSSFLIYKIAVDRGFFAAEGLQPDFITFRGTDLITKSLLLGEIDYAQVLPSVGSAIARGLPLKIVGVVSQGTGYAMISRPEIGSLKALRGKKVAISSFGAASDYAVYTLFAKSGLNPERDVTLLSVGGTASRYGALISGTVDATVVTNPFEYKAEKQGSRILVPVNEFDDIVKLPNSGLGVSQEKIKSHPDQIVRILRAIRRGIQAALKEPELSVSLVQKQLQLDRLTAERFYALHAERFVQELTVPDEVLEEVLTMANFRLPDNKRSTISVRSLRNWDFAQKATGKK